MDMWLVVTFGVVILLLIGVVIALTLLFSRRGGSAGDLSTPLQNLTLSINETQRQTVLLAEKITRLDPLGQMVAGVQLDLRGLSERVSSVEQQQNNVGQGVVAIRTGLAQTTTATSTLLEATEVIRKELAQARNGLTELQTHAKARQEIEARTAESVRRLEAVIAGTQSKGGAGENILEVVFAKLPPEWQVRDFRVGGKQVEFALNLPNGRILPIDSKWPATNLIEQFVASEDPDEQRRLKAQIEAAVLTKAKEVRKYIDPAVTMNFAIAAVPDAVYDLCCGIHTEVYQQNVVLVAYSMFVPYLLLVFQTVLKTSQNIDLEKLDAYLNAAQDAVRHLQEELDGRLPRAITMLNNCRTDMTVHLSKVSAGLTNLLAGTTAATPLAALPRPDDESEVVQLA